MLFRSTSAGDLEMSSIVLEALAAEGRYTLLPAYYDVVLSRKYTRDDESAEMLDLIFGSRVYDIGGVYNFGNVWMDLIHNIATPNDRNIVSFYDRKTGAMERDINRVIDVFQGME